MALLTQEQVDMMSPEEKAQHLQMIQDEIKRRQGGLNMPNKNPIDYAVGGLGGALRGFAGQAPKEQPEISPLEKMVLASQLKGTNPEAYKPTTQAAWQADEKFKAGLNTVDTGEVDEEGKPIMVSKGQAAFQRGEENKDKTAWQLFTSKNNPGSASARSPIGTAVIGMQPVNMALSVLEKPNITVGEAGNAIATISAAYKNGNPEGLETAQIKLANLKEFISGNPQKALAPAMRAHLIEELNTIKDTHQSFINKHLTSTEKLNAKLIKKHQDEWDSMKSEWYKPVGAASGGLGGEGSATRSGKTKSGISYTIEE